MSDNSNPKPTKGILKSTSSFDASAKTSSDLKWDEMNILQTLHPPEKDYGHMKIDEPKTPYSYYDDKEEKEISESGKDELDAKELADRMGKYATDNDLPTAMNSPSDDDEDEDLTEEEKAQRSAFEHKRKMHYNEFYAIKLARTLIDDDEEEDEDEAEKENEGTEKDDDVDKDDDEDE